MKGEIEKSIKQALNRCLSQLSIPSINIYVFPWLNENFNKAFKGVTGFASYKNTVHVFISINKFSHRSLRETITHEFSHAAFLNKSKTVNKLSILDILIFEGLAEQFREEVMKGKPAAWSTALSNKECHSTLELIKSALTSTKFGTYNDIFFGSKKYKKWTGYSIGYQIVKSFRKAYPKKSWAEIMEMKPESIYSLAPFTH